jgi:NADH-quinone oxidoreductase subunit E
MLSEPERREIDAEVERRETPRAASIEALRIVQRHRGFVSDEGIDDVASHLGLSAEEVDGVATFYNLIFRQPVGRHVIFQCDSISCWIMGSDRLRSRLCQRLGIQVGGTTRDRQFTLLPIQCLGTCDHAPAMMVDEDLYRDLSPDDVEALDAILERYLAGVTA